MKRELRVEPEGDGYNIIDQADGSVIDWIHGPRADNHREGDTITYVIITERPEQWHEDMRWMATTGQRVWQVSGLNEGRIGAIAGQARSRRADRYFAKNIADAAAAGRELTDDDFEILIDNEGPLVLWDGETTPDWFSAGQAEGRIAPDAGLADLIENIAVTCREAGWEVDHHVHPSKPDGAILGLAKGWDRVSLEIHHTERA